MKPTHVLEETRIRRSFVCLCVHSWLSCFLLSWLLAGSARAETSVLWGRAGEFWSPQSRLPDFSHAGYHGGEAPLPVLPPGVSVKEFGARGDGVTDDTEAFQQALAKAPRGAIEVPPGRYVIRRILSINRPGMVLRGAGPDKTTLYCITTLQDVKPNWGSITEGRRVSEYSWSGGFLWFDGNYHSWDLANVITEARRGDNRLRVSATNHLSVGRRVVLTLTEKNSDSHALADELYSGDPGDIRNLHGDTHANFVCHVVKIEGNEITLDRPLRWNLKNTWLTRVRAFDPSVTDSGVENLAVEFPRTPYPGHFREMGRNAVAMGDVADCWVRNLLITNADSGFFPNGNFCTFQDIILASARPVDPVSGCQGHHGIDFAGNDNYYTGFDYREKFIHDISVEHSACGNVIARGRGVDLCFDHHVCSPNENLFTDIDAGAGTRLWYCGGGSGLGKKSGARETFWNIRANRAQNWPPEDFGPQSMNLVAVQPAGPSEASLNGRWWEAIAPDRIRPPNLYQAQLARRLHPLTGN